MVTPASRAVRGQLPVRIRTRKGTRNSLAIRLALADRIAALPGIETVEERPCAMPNRVDVFLRPPSASLRRRPEPVRFCTISREGIAVFGLSDRDRYRVLSRGWARLRRRGVNVFLPRDIEELEVCWTILEQAYRTLYDSSATVVTPKIVACDGLPRFSRTILQ